MKKGLLLTLMLSMPLFLAHPAFATIVVGLPPDAGTGNCFPFSCDYNHEYQQVYTGSQFPGSILITGLEFYNTQDDEGATAMSTGNWQISLSTTAADWNSLSVMFANNIGADNTVVFNGNLAQPWAFGNTLAITLSTPFFYNPAAGNLLLDVVSSGVTSPTNIFFDTNGFNNFALNGNTIMGRVYTMPPNNVADAGYGLVTGFQTGTLTPEPAAMFLFGPGLAAVGLLLKKRLAK